jgi:L-threonylcarbamoyladenylate synthase
MKTLRLQIDAHAESAVSRGAISQAAEILRNGGLVAFPTETVYGLGANALDANAVQRIFAAKQRPNWDPLIVHISGPMSRIGMFGKVVADATLPVSALRLTDAFWPGPLTLLLPKSEAMPLSVTAGRPLVGVRMPAHPIASALIEAAGVPIAAPSANSFGRISPTLAAHVLQDLDGRIDAILDGGETLHGLESTVVDASTDPVIVYRSGVITLEQILQVCGSATEYQPSLHNPAGPTPESMPSPGVGIRHYAPRARLLLITGDDREMANRLAGAVQAVARRRERFGVMLPTGFLSDAQLRVAGEALVYPWGDWTNPPLLAHRLFAGLRALDAPGIQVILCPLPPREGIGAAIRDRLLKASRKET